MAFNNKLSTTPPLTLDLALAALSQQAVTSTANSAYASQTVGAGSLGNLSSAMLSASTVTGQQPAPSQPQMKTIPGVGVLSNDAILQAYLGMQQPGGQPYANSEWVCVRRRACYNS